MHYYKLFYNFFNKNLSGTAEHHEVSRRSSWVLTDYHDALESQRDNMK